MRNWWCIEQRHGRTYFKCLARRQCETVSCNFCSVVGKGTIQSSRHPFCIRFCACNIEKVISLKLTVLLNGLAIDLLTATTVPFALEINLLACKFSQGVVDKVMY